jgi:hypothetical protein
MNWTNTLFVIGCFIGCVLVVWSCWRAIKGSREPDTNSGIYYFGNKAPGATVQSTVTNTRGPTEGLVAEYRATFSQDQLEVFRHMAKAHHANQFAEAAALVDKLLPVITDHNSEGYLNLLLIKLDCFLKQNHIEKAECICLEYIQENVSQEQKVKMLDGAASYILYHSLSAFSKQAERFARMGLELAPEKLTLKGTLGGTLVEQGNFAEGELLLHDCLHGSKALHDKAISSFYLGIVKMRNGDARGGKRLIKRAMEMYPEAWLVAKGTALLKG